MITSIKNKKKLTYSALVNLSELENTIIIRDHNTYIVCTIILSVF